MTANAKYAIGQTVKVKKTDDLQGSPRDCDIDAYTGKTGQVSNLYWINPRGEEVFYLYVVRLGESRKEIALHEDELEPCLDELS